jgi:hypothetical protein
LATTEILLSRELRQERPRWRFEPIPFALTLALTGLAVALHGYHPYAEDGGVYLPGILKLVHPELYPTWTGFVTAQSRFSLFAPAVASLVRISGLGLMASILTIYIFSVWLTLFAGWQILSRCTVKREARCAGVLILALCLTTPIAGTSLILMDPYLTARSISTPFSMLAIVGALDLCFEFQQIGRLRIRTILFLSISLLTAASMHPLMAAYSAGCVILLACSSIRNFTFRMAAFGVVALFSIAVALLVNLLAPPQPQGYLQVALTRDYWFLSTWHWYEIAGLIAPLLVLIAIVRHGDFDQRARWLVQMAVAAGLTGITVALLFARESLTSTFVAMLQPLRIFHTVYIVLFLLAGAAMADVFLKRIPLRWSTTCLALGAMMFFVQIRTFPHSSHLEFPQTVTHNDWERGFLWIRNNTPIDAVFALDANYITSAGEDTQNFRAIAQRSSLPDYAKDGGIAAVDPGLTSNWITGEKAQGSLAENNDAERKSKLSEVHVHWLVLPLESRTAFTCPYQNGSMKVCRMPDR